MSVRLQVESRTASETAWWDGRALRACVSAASPIVIRSSRSSGVVRWFSPMTTTDTRWLLVGLRWEELPGGVQHRSEQGSCLTGSSVEDQVKHPRIAGRPPSRGRPEPPRGRQPPPPRGEGGDERHVPRAEPGGAPP